MGSSPLGGARSWRGPCPAHLLPLAAQVCHHAGCQQLHHRGPLNLCEACDSKFHSTMHYDGHVRFDLPPQGKHGSGRPARSLGGSLQVPCLGAQSLGNCRSLDGTMRRTRVDCKRNTSTFQSLCPTSSLTEKRPGVVPHLGSRPVSPRCWVCTSHRCPAPGRGPAWRRSLSSCPRAGDLWASPPARSRGGGGGVGGQVRGTCSRKQETPPAEQGPGPGPPPTGCAGVPALCLLSQASEAQETLPLYQGLQGLWVWSQGWGRGGPGERAMGFQQQSRGRFPTLVHRRVSRGCRWTGIESVASPAVSSRGPRVVWSQGVDGR